MTAKDLNLLTDPTRLAAWAEQNALSAPPRPDVSTNRPARPRADLSAVPRENPRNTHTKMPQPKPGPESSSNLARPLAKKPKVQRAGTAKQHRVRVDRHWLLTAAIAIVNMLFLGLAAIWLTGTDLKGTFSSPDNNNEIGLQATMIALQETNQRLAAITLELGSVKAQLSELDAKISSPPALEQAPSPSAKPTAVLPAQAATSAPAPEVTIAEKQAKPAPTSWQINLGDYSTRKEARAAQRTLQNIGLQAQISPLKENGMPGFLVSISGFADRQDAEDVASEVMIDTDLNGLWVAKTP